MHAPLILRGEPGNEANFNDNKSNSHARCCTMITCINDPEPTHRDGKLGVFPLVAMP